MTTIYDIPVVGLFKADQVLQSLIAKKNIESLPDDFQKISIQFFEKQLADSFERKKILEEKAKSSILGITVSIPVLFSGGSYLFRTVKTAPGCDGCILRTLLGTAIGLLIVGGLFSFRVLRIRKIYLISAGEEAEILSLSKKDALKERKLRTWRATESNNLENLRQSNGVDESNNFISMGIVFMGLFIGYLLFFSKFILP